MLYEFEDFCLDTARRELRRADALLQVEPKAFDVIEFLIRNRDRVVSKDELLSAVWNGRIVSESALTTCINAARTALGDSGEAQRLLRTSPRKGIRFVGDVRERAATSPIADLPDPAAERASPAPLSGAAGEVHAGRVREGISIAVMPFTNLSDDREQGYFADGIVDELITALSRFKSFFVIARSSSFTYKGRVIEARQVARELGVRYVVEGSVRKALNRVRITGQLVDAELGSQLWADRFDGALEDIFELQDRVSLSVVSAVAPTLVQAEIERAKRKPTESLDAYDHYLRGLEKASGMSHLDNDAALKLFRRAIELDPRFATAYGMATWCYVFSHVNGWTTNYAGELPEIERLARTAAQLGSNDATALAYAGVALARIVGDLKGGIALIDRALSLNPNLAAAWTFSGWARSLVGDSEAAIGHLQRAMQLSPLDPLVFISQMCMSLALFVAGRYDEGTSWAVKALQVKPNFQPSMRLLIVNTALAGQVEDARRSLNVAVSLDPAMRISNLKDRIGPFRPEDAKRYGEGLRLAGLPE